MPKFTKSGRRLTRRELYERRIQNIAKRDGVFIRREFYEYPSARDRVMTQMYLMGEKIITIEMKFGVFGSQTMRIIDKVRRFYGHDLIRRRYFIK